MFQYISRIFFFLSNLGLKYKLYNLIINFFRIDYIYFIEMYIFIENSKEYIKYENIHMMRMLLD